MGYCAGQWLGSILTGGSLLLAFSILIRDRKKAEQQQAAKVTCWIEPDLSRPEAIVYNHSDEPVIKSRIIALPKLRLQRDWDSLSEVVARSESVERARMTHFSRPFILDNERPWLKAGKHASTIMLIENGLEVYDAFLEFHDTSGRKWIREVPGGKLLSRREMRNIERRIMDVMDRQDRAMKDARNRDKESQEREG